MGKNNYVRVRSISSKFGIYDPLSCDAIYPYHNEKPQYAVWIPDDMEFATIEIPVLTENKKNNYTLDYSTEKRKVMRVYVKHKPDGYKEEQFAYGRGTKEDPFLTFDHAYKFAWSFLYYTCSLSVQFIILNGSSSISPVAIPDDTPPTCLGYGEEMIVNRMILGSTDETTYFDIDSGKYCVHIVSQAQSADDGISRVSPGLGDPLFRESSKLVMFVNIQKNEKVHADALGGTIFWNEEGKTGFRYSSYSVSEKTVTGHGQYITVETKKKTQTEKFRVLYRSDYYGFLRDFIRSYDATAENKIVIEWSNGKKTDFLRTGEDTYAAQNVHAPNLRFYTKLTMRHDQDDHTEYFSFEGNFIQESEERKYQDAEWEIAKLDNEKWVSAGGEIKAEYEINGEKQYKKVFTLDLFYKFIPAVEKYAAVWKCKNVYSPAYATISSEIIYDDTSFKASGYMWYDCHIEGVTLSGANRIVDKCICRNCDYIFCYALSRSVVEDAIEVDADMIYSSEISCEDLIPREILKSKIQCTKISFSSDTYATRDITDSTINCVKSFTVNNLLNSTVTVEIESVSDYFNAAVTIKLSASDSTVNLNGTLELLPDDYGSRFVATEIGDKTLVSNLNSNCNITVAWKDTNENECYAVALCDISIGTKCVKGCRILTHGNCNSVPDYLEDFCKEE